MICNACPRKCNLDRALSKGVCGVDDKIRVAKIMLHMWEEPCISGTNGSGAIFFSGCNLRCVYCQNREISHSAQGKELSVRELADKMLLLQEKGAHNINLVTPTHFSKSILEALKIIKSELKIPVVYNTSGYELPCEIEKLAGYVDVFLVDVKYFSKEASKKYSNAPDYYDYAKESLSRMLQISPECKYDENGIMTSGVILRHLVLPTLRKDSMKILEDVSQNFDISKLKLSLMCQYTPDFCSNEYKEIKRKLTSFEYTSVVDYATELGYDGYIQEMSSASKIYTPDFKCNDLEL